jgi:hypothetical protein
MAHHIDFE